MSNDKVNVKDVPADVFNLALADILKREKKFEFPRWAEHVKTGCNREMPPTQENWYFIRAAAILRQAYLHKTVTVEKLRFRFGGNQHPACTPEHHRRSSGKIIRSILQSLCDLGYLKHEDGSSESPRCLSKKGMDILRGVARDVAQRRNK